MANITFLKLGGSLITDKTGVEALRQETLTRLVAEIGDVWRTQPDFQLVLGHGSGSFGHVPAKKYGTRDGVKTAEQWLGFAQVGQTAARLNRLVLEALLEEGVPAISVPPSASALCRDGQIVSMNVGTVAEALDAGMLPVVQGDVAFDQIRGGTILSTEEVMAFLATHFTPNRLLLAGETAGVLDATGESIPQITPANIGQLQEVLGGSRGADVTGGMASKVQGMLILCRQFSSLQVHIFSGLVPGLLRDMLLGRANAGTLICNAGKTTSGGNPDNENH